MANVISDSNTTARSERIHIGIFGATNSGKSSLINALTGQNVALVSAVAGTTTDPVTKNIELPGLGACVVIDTAGYDDQSSLGQMRINATRKALDRCDIAIWVCATRLTEQDISWVGELRRRSIPLVGVVNKIDKSECDTSLIDQITEILDEHPLCIDAQNGEGIDALRIKLRELGEKTDHTILGNLVGRGNTVLLVMPQDAQAPKGRLILPQVQVLRELLDRGCIAICLTPEQLTTYVASAAVEPDLVITDSQVFDFVHAAIPAWWRLTSFSVLFANYKGDVAAFIEGAKAIDALTESSHVLIAEACTHAPASEDIGRVKIPAMLRKRVGEGLSIDIVSGNDFPDSLEGYDLVIHCGACMFNRRHVLSRIAQAHQQGTPITNYGIAIAHLKSILGKIVYPTT